MPVKLFLKAAFHVLYVIRVHSDLDAYPGKLQSKNMSFTSKEAPNHNNPKQDPYILQPTKFEFWSQSKYNLNSPLYINISAGIFAEASSHNAVRGTQDFQKQ